MSDLIDGWEQRAAQTVTAIGRALGPSWQVGMTEDGALIVRTPQSRSYAFRDGFAVSLADILTEIVESDESIDPRRQSRRRS